MKRALVFVLLFVFLFTLYSFPSMAVTDVSAFDAEYLTLSVVKSNNFSWSVGPDWLSVVDDNAGARCWHQSDSLSITPSVPGYLYFVLSSSNGSFWREDGLYVRVFNYEFPYSFVSGTAQMEDHEEPFPAAVLELFGSYQPRYQLITVVDAAGNATEHLEPVPGLAGLDWPWLASVAIFALFLFCLLRMVGGIFKWT